MLFRIETTRIANAIISVNASNMLKMCLTPFRVVWLTAYRSWQRPVGKLPTSPSYGKFRVLSISKAPAQTLLAVNN